VIFCHLAFARSVNCSPVACCGSAAALPQKLRATLRTSESGCYTSRPPSACMQTGPPGETHDAHHEAEARHPAGVHRACHPAGRRARPARCPEDRRHAYRIQELAYGGLKPETQARLEALGEQFDGGKITVRRMRGDDKPIAGTQLIREYQGIEHVVTVTRAGYEYQGRPYQSLSAIARAITGTRWNGRVFFGLRPSRAAA
jgi:hypothetical protein